ncbi:MBL fold metallo-hydrolase [Barrientosiimonas marina]|uniref:MBL fold metallo-hydrolase n=1 Tax=Lentibacillus kimchii TaxID=1542911 RepID=A0ABW2UTS8_9BACI
MLRHSFTAFITAFFLVMAGCGTDDAEQSAADADTDDAETTEAVTTDTAEDSDAEPKEDNEDKDEADEKANDSEKDDSEQTANSSALQELTVQYIDAAQADATLFQYGHDGEPYTILFDTGDWQRDDVVNYLANQAIADIDLIVISHPHSDHIGQLAEIVNTYDVGEVWMSGNISSSKTFQKALQAVKNSGADYHEPRTGEEFSIGPMAIDVLYPNSISSDLNEESVSLHMAYGDVNFVFTGDAEKAAEASMVQSDAPLDADILQLGHHGSNTSSTSAFIEAVDPDTAIYSAGADNQYGHPHAEVVNRIQDAGIDLYGTDVHGTITVTTDGTSYDISTEKEGTIRAESTGSAETSASNQSDSEPPANKNTSGNGDSASTGGCVDINNASAKELQNIKYIGKKRAPNVSDHRPFDSVDDLTDVKGIGDAYIKKIKAEDVACVKS